MIGNYVSNVWHGSRYQKMRGYLERGGQTLSYIPIGLLDNIIGWLVYPKR